MMPVYGLAESSVGLAFAKPGSGINIDRVNRNIFMDTGQAVQAGESESSPLEFVSCGQPLPGHQIRIADGAGRELPERTEGSLQFSGPSTTSGYFKNPEKTKELFHDQWLNSGDKAYLAAGNVYITGRSKDIIIRAGRNIYPVELEEEVGKVNGIREGNVAVFGSKSSDSGTERLIILAETRKKREEDLESIRNSITNIVTDLAGTPPDEIVLAPPNSVLKTSSGKIRRNASREIYERKRIGKPQQAAWMQLTRFMIKGLRLRIRSSFQQLKAVLFATWSWILYCLLAPVVGVLVFALPVEKLRWSVMRLAVKFLATMTRTKIRVHGLENLQKTKETSILVANHASYLDGYVVTAVLDRPISFIAKAELKANAIVGILLKRIGTLFVERFDQQKGVEDAKKIADKEMTNRSIFFFPEGTFMRMPGLLPFKMGAFETAARTGLPIIPIAIRGTRSILRSGSWFPRYGTISVTFGEPIIIENPHAEEQETWQDALQLRAQAREWILLHCGEPDLGHERPRLQPSGPTLNG
jgi:1-acyl-sn-glycerol-3-phosphate acyltransferase